MATVGIRAPLRFHGTPQLVEGLAPFRYADVLAGAAVQVTLPGESTVMIEIEASTLNVTANISICLSHPMLAPIIEKLSAQS